MMLHICLVWCGANFLPDWSINLGKKRFVIAVSPRPYVHLNFRSSPMTSVSSRRTRRPQWPRSHSIRGNWWISLTGCCRYLFQLLFLELQKSSKMSSVFFSLVSNYKAPNSRELESNWCYLFLFLSLYAPVFNLCLTPPHPFLGRCWLNRRFRGKAATLSKWTRNISACSWTPFSLNSMLPPSSRWVCLNCTSYEFPRWLRTIARFQMRLKWTQKHMFQF